MIINCPECNQEYEIEPAQIGYHAECEACKKEFIITNPNLIKCSVCFKEISAKSNTCIHCGHSIIEQIKAPSKIEPEIKNGEAVKKTSMLGIGCLLQGVGLVLIIIGVVFILTIILPMVLIPVGIWFLIYGSMESSWYECSLCRTKLANKKVKICPSCNANFKS